MKQLRHVLDSRRRRAVRKCDGPGAIPRPTVVVADSPAASTPDSVCSRYADSADVGDAIQAKMFAPRHKKNGSDTAHQPAPENEPGATEEGAPISHQDCVVDLA